MIYTVCCPDCGEEWDNCSCEDDPAYPDYVEDGLEFVWCPLFRHQIGITHRNTGVCRHCVSEGFQEAPSDG